MTKKANKLKLLLLTLLILVSPILWLVLGNMPSDFSNTQSWIYIMTFAVMAFAVYVAFDSNKK